MNQILNMKGVKYIAYAAAGCFLMIHILLLILFYKYDVTPMLRFNIFSCLFYACSAIVIYSGRLRLFVAATYIEIIVHMTLAVYYVGWNSGFQITLIGINIMGFFAEYIGRTVNKQYIPALPFSLLGMAAYIGIYIVSDNHPAMYHLPSDVSFWLQIIWGAVVFIINIIVLQGFVMISFHSEELLSDKARRDKLTDLPNRYYMYDYLEKLIAQDDLEEYWVAMVDIDDFKKINDSFGHMFGDYILQKISDLMRLKLTDEEICRWGGEEFLIVGKLNGNYINVYRKLDDFRQFIEDQLFSYEDQNTNLTLTIGMASYRSGDSITEWIKTADKNLYIGKHSGKNQVV